MVVALHFEVKDLGVAGGGGGNKARVEELEDSVADVGEFALDLGSVVADDGDVVLVASALLLLLDGGDDAPGSASGADDVLVGNREEVALLDREFLVLSGGRDLLHELHHLLVALGLLRQLGHVHELFAWRGSAGHCGIWLGMREKEKERES